LMSTHIWDSFSDQERGWLSQAVKESVIEQRKLWAESEKQSLDAVKEAGVEIIIPDKTLFSKKSKKILESYKEDEVLYDFINRIKNTK